MWLDGDAVFYLSQRKKDSRVVSTQKKFIGKKSPAGIIINVPSEGRDANNVLIGV